MMNDEYFFFTFDAEYWGNTSFSFRALNLPFKNTLNNRHAMKMWNVQHKTIHQCCYFDINLFSNRVLVCSTLNSHFKIEKVNKAIFNKSLWQLFSFLYRAIVLDIQIIKPTIYNNVLFWILLHFKTFYTY